MAHPMQDEAQPATAAVVGTPDGLLEYTRQGIAALLREDGFRLVDDVTAVTIGVAVHDETGVTVDLVHHGVGYQYRDVRTDEELIVVAAPGLRLQAYRDVAVGLVAVCRAALATLTQEVAEPGQPR